MRNAGCTMERWQRTSAINVREIVGSIEILVEKFRFGIFVVVVFRGKLNSMHFDLNETKLFVS